jgi:hypothetical protein
MPTKRRPNKRQSREPVPIEPGTPQRGELLLVKGNRPTLTAAQQDLMGIFADHLRSLPKFTTWKGPDRKLVADLLSGYFKKRNPEWGPREDGTGWFIDDLPEKEWKRYEFLQEHASTLDERPETESDTCVRLQREIKRQIIDLAARYENLRQNAGMSREQLLCIPVTPLEVAAQATFNEYHQSAEPENHPKSRKKKS